MNFSSRFNSSRAWNRMQFVLFALILVFATYMRVGSISTPLHVDEGTEYKACEPGNATVFSICRATHYPLSKVLSHFFLQFEDSARGLRYASLLAGLATIIALYYLLVQVTRSKLAGYIGALLLATAPAHFVYSQDGRYYSLLMLFGVTQILFLIKYAQSQRPMALCGYFISLALGFLSHPFFLLYAVCTYAGYGVWLLCARRALSIAVLREAAYPGVILGMAAGLSHWYKLSLKPRVSLHPVNDYLLLPGHYIEMLKTLWLQIDMPYQALWAASAIVGLCVIAVRYRLYLGILVACVVLLPLPLMAITVKHWYADRYFVIAVPLFVSCAAIGLWAFLTGTVSLYGWLKHRTFSRVLHSMATLLPIGAVLISAGIYVGMVKSAHPYRDREERIYEGPLWKHDWPGITGYLSDFIQQNDVIVWDKGNFPFIDWQDHYKRPFEIYMNWHFPSSTDSALWANQSLVHDDTTLSDTLKANPLRNIWLLEHKGTRNDVVKVYREMFPIIRFTESIRFRVAGEPTTNMVTGGSFDKETAKEAGSSKETVLSRDDYVDSFTRGKTAQLFSSATEDAAFVQLEIKPAPVRLRNGSFKAWVNGRPAGWEINGDGQRITQKSGGHGLQVEPGDEGVSLTNFFFLAPHAGATLTLPDAGPGFNISLGYQTGSGNRVIHAQEQRRISLPDDTKPGSVYLAVDCHGTSHTLTVPPLNVEVSAPGALFDKHSQYTLSFSLKHKDVREVDGEGTGLVSLVGTYRTGEKFEAVLCRFSGTADWHSCAVTLDPLRQLALQNVQAADVRIALTGSQGEVEIDNVQLEPKPYATPFVDGVRLPHDEVIADFDF